MIKGKYVKLEATRRLPVISRRPHLQPAPSHRSRTPQGYPHADVTAAALILATSRSHLLTRLLQERNNRTLFSDLSSCHQEQQQKQASSSSTPTISLEPSAQSAFQSPNPPSSPARAPSPLLQVSPVIKDELETLKDDEADQEGKEPQKSSTMLFERENHQMAPLEDSQVAPSEVQAPNKESLTEANTSTGGPTATTGGNESWIAVAETDALRRAEADAEASFMVSTTSSTTASPLNHHSTQTSQAENNTVHHHHHHHHHHYHHHHHSLSLGSSKAEDKPPPPVEHPSPPTPPINKTPLRALINSALVENSAKKYPQTKKLARSNTTLDANSSGNSSQPGSPQIRALKSLRTQSQEENHPPSNSPQ